MKYILAIDQGTSSTKTRIVDAEGNCVAKGTELLHTSYFENGFVEQDPEELYKNVLTSVKKCLDDFSGKGYKPSSLASIGISNQRETFVLWDADGRPLYPAIVWQCKRSVQLCEELTQRGLSGIIRDKTGLVIDPYFSGTKLMWLRQHLTPIRESIRRKEAYFGTVDTWLLYKLTRGGVFATDFTNASRTMLFNLKTLSWDEELIEAFGLNGIRLPEVKPSSSHFGETTVEGMLPAAIPVTALIGDSHAAAFGEGCFEPGMAKATMGTGSSLLMNIGNAPILSANGMVTTVCWSMEGRVDYALEGVIVSCGATIEWLKNTLQLFTDSRETEEMASVLTDNAGVYLIPAFSGLGSPHWQMDRRASIHGMSFGTTKNHIVRAALESIAYQIRDVITAMEKDAGLTLSALHTDGGITANRFVMQFTADVLNKKVSTIGMPDVSALGAAFLSGLQAGVYKDIGTLKDMIKVKQDFNPTGAEAAAAYYENWKKYIRMIPDNTLPTTN